MSEEAQFAAIADAMDLIDSCDGALLTRVRAWRAVRGAPLYRTLAPPPGPSVGGLTEAQMQDVAARQASADRAWQNEVAARQRWLDDQENENIIKGLTAGQTEENARQIRAAFAAQRARG